jgi:thiamine-phosphate pyrophosphorylase
MKLREYLDVYFITNPNFGYTHEEIAEIVLKAGVRIIQFREKLMPTKKMVETAKRLRKLTQEYDALFIVNDRIDVALASHADGVHVGQQDMPADLTREIFDGIIGVSARNANEASNAEMYADYIGAGPVFPTKTKEDAGKAIGVEGLVEIVRATSIPVVAVGSINKNNAIDALKAGAVGIAVISAIAAAKNPEKEAKILLEIVKDFKKRGIHAASTHQ